MITLSAQIVQAVSSAVLGLWTPSTTGSSVLCFAHVTNQIGRTDGDFEKGEANGARDAIRLIEAIVSVADPR